MTDYLTRARAGVAFLEEWHPGVTDLIDVARMDVRDGLFCPAAQALRAHLDKPPSMYVGFSDFVDTVYDDMEKLAAMGFCFYLREWVEFQQFEGMTDREYELLTEAWRTALAEHRATKEVTS